MRSNSCADVDELNCVFSLAVIYKISTIFPRVCSGVGVWPNYWTVRRSKWPGFVNLSSVLLLVQRSPGKSISEYQKHPIVKPIRKRTPGSLLPNCVTKSKAACSPSKMMKYWISQNTKPSFTTIT